MKAGIATKLLAGVLFGALLISSASGALTLDLINGGKFVPVSVGTEVVTLNVWATTGNLDGNAANDGISRLYAAFYSSNGGLIKGNMSLAFTPTNPLNNNLENIGGVPTPAVGAMADLDGDGDLDVGSTVVAVATGWTLAKAATGMYVVGPVNFATLTFTSTGWNAADLHGVTEIWGIGRPSSVNNSWKEDGVSKTGMILTGEKIVLYRPAAPAGQGFTINPGESKTFDGSASVGSVNQYSWDFNGDGIFEVLDSLIPTAGVTFDYLTGTLGLAAGDHLATLRTSYLYGTEVINGATVPVGFTILPEPATLALLGIGGLITLIRRRRA